MAHGKMIELYYPEGTVEGIATASILNWSGKAIKIPRSEVTSCTRTDIKMPGIYFLFIKSDDGIKKDSVYIGEADDVLQRLKGHIQSFNQGNEDYYWNTAVSFVGNDLNKSYVRYLEHRLVQIAKQCGQFDVRTKSTFQNTILSEAQRDAMEEFIENIQLLIGALGYRVLESIGKKANVGMKFSITSRGSNATGYITADGFVVEKDSLIANTVTNAFQNCSYQKLRNDLIENGKIVDFKFVDDYEFASPSAASSVITGNPSNGRADWKFNGKSLKDCV